MLHRYYERSDSCPTSPELQRSRAFSPARFVGQVSLLHVLGLSDHSVPNHPTRPIAALSRYPSARWVSLSGQGFAVHSQARRQRQAETGLSSYGLVEHLPLLPTLPRGSAVMFGFRPESVCLRRDLTSMAEYAPRRTSAARSAALDEQSKAALRAALQGASRKSVNVQSIEKYDLALMRNSAREQFP